MAAQTRRDLFLQVSADTSTFTAAMKAGKSVLADFGNSANATADEVQKAFQKLAGGNIENTARTMEDAYKRSFAAIRAGARAVADAPSNIAAFDILGANATREAVANAETRVSALRMLAAEARNAAAGDSSGEQRAYAVAADANVVATERVLAAERSKLAVLEAVESQMRSAGLATREDAAAEAELAARATAAAAAQEALKTRGDALMRSIDPLYAAQARYNDAIAVATELRDAGVLTAERYAQAEAAAAASLRQVADAAAVAAEKQMQLYAAQAADARIEVAGDRFQALIASAMNVRQANKSAADSYRVFEEAGMTAGEKVEGAHNRMGASGMMLQHVIRSTTDSFAAGLPPTMIFAEQVGRLGEAAALSGGTMGKFGEFMMGGWGIAITIGVSVLGSLVGKLLDVSDAAKKAKDAEEDYAKFQGDLSNFVDTANGHLRERLRLLAEIASRENAGKIKEADDNASSLANQAFDKARDAAGINRIGTNRGAESPIDYRLSKAIADAKGDAGQLVRNLDALAKSAPQYRATADAIGHVAGQALLAQQNAAKLRGQQSDFNKLLNGGTINDTARIDRLTAERVATTAVEKATAALNNVKARGAEIDKMDAGRDKTRALQQYARDLLAATRAQKAAQEAAKTTRNTADRQTGRQIDLAQAEDIVHGIGGRITSSTRTREQQQALYDRYQAYKAGAGPWAPMAAKPGTSEHETGQALDIAMTPGMSRAKIRKAFEDQGVRVSELFDEGNHFHVAWGKKGASAETMARREHAATVRDANLEGSYQSDLAQAQSRFVKAQLALSDTAEKRAAIDIDELRYAQQQKVIERAAQVKAGKLTAPQAERLNNIDVGTEALAELAVQRRTEQANLDTKLAIDRREIDGKMAMLQLQADAATTAADRRRIALQLLAQEEAAARAEANRDLLSADPERQARGRDVLGQIDEQHAGKVERTKDQTMSPMEGYRDQLKRNVGDLNEAMQGVEASGLQNVQDGLLSILSGTKSVAAGFRDMAASIISDIERIALEKLVLSFIGLKGGGVVSGFAAGGLPGFAAGASSRIDGLIRGPGTGLSDSILALVGGVKPIRIANGESIVTAAATKKHWPIIKAMNEGRLPGFATGMVPESAIYLRAAPNAQAMRRAPMMAGPTFDLRGAVMTEDLVRQMHGIAAHYATAAIPAASQIAQNEMAEDGFARIPG